jgi:predicted nucleic-acid-binding protein
LIALDTNILVRFLTRDDPGQAAWRSGADVLVTFDRKAARLDGVVLPGGDRRP